MYDKGFFIKAYFNQWTRDVASVKRLMDDPRYYREGILVLSCYIGAFASLRYPRLSDGIAYKQVILEYSGNRPFFEQIDLLFLYQWPRSKLREHGTYKALKNHTEIIQTLTGVYGSEDSLKNGIRYVCQSDVIRHVIGVEIPNLDQTNLQENLPLFSLVELFYRYVRCDAVHNVEFPFLKTITDSDRNTYYEDNHAITGKVIVETAESIINSLCDKCLQEIKWPHELG